MAIEAFAIAGASLATIIIAKIKFYIKKKGLAMRMWVHGQTIS